MIYLKVPWVDGTDADYHKFHSLIDAVQWLWEHQEDEFMLSSEVMDIPEGDYTEHQETKYSQEA